MPATSVTLNVFVRVENQVDSEHRALRDIAESGGRSLDPNEASARASATADSASSMSELGIVLQQQGKLCEAEELFR